MALRLTDEDKGEGKTSGTKASPIEVIKKNKALLYTAAGIGIIALCWWGYNKILTKKKQVTSFAGAR